MTFFRDIISLVFFGVDQAQTVSYIGGGKHGPIMKTSLLFKVAALAVLLSGMLSGFPRAQAAHEAGSATHFVESLYSLYGPNGNPPDLSGANASQYFYSSLIELARNVRATAGPRYSGALDYDHLCNCKDTKVSFPNLRIVARSVTSDQAVATVTFDGKDGTRNRILINLTLEAGQWHISDVKDYTGPPPYTGLRALLKREISAWSKVLPPR